jgi:hypothetical protein
VFANVTALFERRPQNGNWTQQELAEFYRVESALIQGGLRIETDHGVSDEGDPWFVFCRADNGEPVAHFARMNGEYIIASPAYEGVSRGRDFRSMVQNLISRHRLLPDTVNCSKVLFHPGALLIAVVGTAFFKVSDAEASDLGKPAPDDTKKALHSGSDLSSLLVKSGIFSPVVAGAIGAAASAEYALIAVVATLVSLDYKPPTEFTSLQQSPAASHSSVSVAFDQDVNQGGPLVGHQAAPRGSEVVPLSALAFVDDDAAQSLDAALSLTATLKELPVQHLIPDRVVTADMPFGAPKDPGLATQDSNHVDQSVAASSFSLTMPGVQVANEARNDGPVSKPHGDQVVGSGTVMAATVDDLKPFFAAVGSHSVISFDSLPSTLADVISHGIIVSEQGTVFDFVMQHPLVLTAVAEQNGKGALANIADVDPGQWSTMKVALVSQADTDNVAMLSTEALAKLIATFVSETPDWEMIVTKQSVVFVSADLVQAVGTGAESITLSFHDGSAISIVGQPSALDHIVATI